MLQYNNVDRRKIVQPAVWLIRFSVIILRCACSAFKVRLYTLLTMRIDRKNYKEEALWIGLHKACKVTFLSLFSCIERKTLYLCIAFEIKAWELSHGVMVAQLVLVQLVRVRILVRQHPKRFSINWEAFFIDVNCD